MASGVNCQSDNCTITNCWACYYSHNILPFPKIPPSCPRECENPLDEVCMEKWGQCVYESFLSIYHKVGLLLYVVKYIVQICHSLIQETVNSVSLQLCRFCLSMFIQKTFTAGTTSPVFHIECLSVIGYRVY